MAAEGVKKPERDCGRTFPNIFLHRETGWLLHFHPFSIGGVSSGKGVCSLHSRTAAILARERNDGPNSFPICTVSMKMKVIFELETSKSVSFIQHHYCPLGQPGSWTRQRNSPSSCGLPNKNKLPEGQSSTKSRLVGQGAPAAPGTLSPCQPRRAAPVPSPGAEALCSRESQGVFHRWSSGALCSTAGSPNTACRVTVASRHPHSGFYRICQMKMKGSTDLHLNSLGVLYFKYSNLDE